MNLTEENDLWITFRLDQRTYCVSSGATDSIALPDAISPLPGNPDWCLGFLEHGGSLIPVVEMRTLFHLPNLEQCAEAFSQMKEMHVSWTAALREAVETGTPFTSAVDPHRCKFGVWYDHFETDNYELNFILNKIAAPHERIHLCGAEINAMMARGDREAAIARLAEAEDICRNQMLPMLDRLILAYREANRGIIVIVRRGKSALGLLVDEVTGLIPRARTRYRPLPKTTRYLAGVVQDGKHLYLRVNTEELPFLSHMDKEGELN